MNKEKKTYIEGIYNYCDRWCERCRFTANCYLFTTESRIASHQILNDGEMPKAEDIFPQLEDIDEEDDNFFTDDDEDEDFFQSDVQKDSFGELPDSGGEEFTPEEEEDDDKEFFETNKTLLEQLGNEYLLKAHPLIKKIDEKYSSPKEAITDTVLKKLYDNFEIFAWYHAFIYVKFKRALHGKKDILEEDDEEMKEIHAYDMNGTAKIATISVNNSIEALNELFGILPDFSKEISELLVILGKLKNEAEKEFPDCKNFKRPGFDE